MQILLETSCIENGWILLNRLCVVIILCSVPAVGLFSPTYKACVIIFLSLFQVKYQRHDLCKKYYREEEQYMGRRFPLLLRVLQLVLWELKIINTRLLEWNILQKVVVKYFITSCKQEGEWAYNLNCEAQRTFSVILVQNSLARQQVSRMADQENFSQYLDVPDLEVTDKSIYYSKPATVFAAVAASIFTIIGVLGELDSF